MKIKGTLCEVSLVALLAAVFAAFPVPLDGQNANSHRSPDVNDLFAKREALLNDSGDFNKMLQTLGTSSPNLGLELQILDELAAVIDHVKAFSTGGTDDAENLATACNKCNTRKNNLNAKEWETEHPVKRIKSKFGEPQAWDGFSSLFLYLAKPNTSRLKQSEIDWMKALEAVEEKPAVNVAPVEADAEKRESHIVDITDEFVKRGTSLIFTGVEKP